MTVERVRVSDVFTLARREVTVEPTVDYKLVGVYSFGRGLFNHDPKPGSELGAYRFFEVQAGDLVLSNIGAWEGGIGFARDEDAGLIGNHRVLTYVPRDGRIIANWGRWFFLSENGLNLIRQAAPGTVMRNRTLSIQRFEALEIPLSPIDDQRRVAERLDRLEAAAAELKNHSARASALTGAFMVASAARPDFDHDAKVQAGWRRASLGSVMTLARQRVTVEPDGSYPNVGIYSFGRGLFAKAEIDGSTTSAKVLNRIRGGQFIYSRLFAFEGAYTYVPSEFDGYHVSNEFPAFDTDEDRLDARWLANYLRSPERWAELGGRSKGLGVRRQRVPVEAVLDYEVWLPPIATQRAIVTSIDRTERVDMSREQTRQRIDALVPAALNQAFASLS